MACDPHMGAPDTGENGEGPGENSGAFVTSSGDRI